MQLQQSIRQTPRMSLVKLLMSLRYMIKLVHALNQIHHLLGVVHQAGNSTNPSLSLLAYRFSHVKQKQGLHRPAMNNRAGLVSKMDVPRPKYSNFDVLCSPLRRRMRCSWCECVRGGPLLGTCSSMSGGYRTRASLVIPHRPRPAGL